MYIEGDKAFLVYIRVAVCRRTYRSCVPVEGFEAGELVLLEMRSSLFCASMGLLDDIHPHFESMLTLSSDLSVTNKNTQENFFDQIFGSPLG